MSRLGNKLLGIISAYLLLLQAGPACYAQTTCIPARKAAGGDKKATPALTTQNVRPEEVQADTGLPALPMPPEVAAHLQQLHQAEVRTIQHAWVHSTLLPGLGQIQNKQAWKVPYIYAGFALLLSGAHYKHNKYLEVKHAAVRSSRSGLIYNRRMEYSQRDRDLFLIFAGLWYLANILDAYAGASLMNFDLSEDIDYKRPKGQPVRKRRWHISTSSPQRHGLVLTVNLVS